MALPELLHLLCRRLWVVSRVCPPSCRSPARLPLPRSRWSGWGSSSHVALLLWAFDSAAGLRKMWKKTSGLCFFPIERCLGFYFTAAAVMVIRVLGHSQCFVFIILSYNWYLGNALLSWHLEYCLTLLPEQPTVLWEAGAAADSQLRRITLGRNEK